MQANESGRIFFWNILASSYIVLSAIQFNCSVVQLILFPWKVKLGTLHCGMLYFCACMYLIKHTVKNSTINIIAILLQFKIYLEM